MPLNIQMPAYLAKPLYWIGSISTPSPWKAVLRLLPKLNPSTLNVSNELYPTEPPLLPTTQQYPSHLQTCLQTSVSPSANEPSSAAAAWTLCLQIITVMSLLHLL